jgi:hypothetical protein
MYTYSGMETLDRAFTLAPGLVSIARHTSLEGFVAKNDLGLLQESVLEVLPSLFGFPTEFPPQN